MADTPYLDKNGLSEFWSAIKDYFDFSGLLDTFYPVGCYFETSDSTFDPNVSWGGTWVLENSGLFHRSGSSVTGADADDGKGEKDGGESEVTLTYNQTGMKNHSHSYSKPPSSTDGFTLKATHIPAHTHGSESITGWFGIRRFISNSYGTVYAVGGKMSKSASSSATSATPVASNGSTSIYGDVITMDATHTHTSVGGGNEHKHAITNTTGTTTGNPSNANASEAHENKPPYVDVFRWHRTA